MKRKTFLACLLALAIAVFCVTSAGSYYYGLIEENALFKGKVDYQAGSVIDIAGALRSEPVVLAYTAGTGYSITASMDGLVFEVPLSGTTEQAESDNCAIGPAGSGTTLLVFEPTEAMDGRPIIVRNASGTTNIIIQGASGATKILTSSAVTKQVGEDYGDTIWLQASYGDLVGWERITEYEAD